MKMLNVCGKNIAEILEILMLPAIDFSKYVKKIIDEVLTKRIGKFIPFQFE